MTSARLPLCLLLGLGACVSPPEPTPTEEAPAPGAKEVAAQPADPNALTAEELELIKANPKTLTPEQNRKRSYALRKQVMQDPNSDAYKALEEARQAALAGEIQPPGSEQKKGGLVIEAPEHLRNPDQSYGEPAL